MGLFDSLPQLPRWAYTAAGVGPTNTTEPPSQQKDVGWEDTDPPPYQWWNWVWATTYIFLGYLDRVWESIWTHNFVVRDGVTTTCEVTETSPVSMGVDVADGRVWIQGSFYEVDGATVTLDAADATNDRIDAIVAERNVTTGVVSYSKVTGTPAATPVSPGLSPTKVRLADVYVSAGATSVSSVNITDLRRRGWLSLGRLTVDNEFQVGSIGGSTTDFMLELARNASLKVDSAYAIWKTTQVRKLNLAAGAFATDSGASHSISKGALTVGTVVVAVGGTYEGWHSVDIPDGVVIKAIRLRGRLNDAAQQMWIQLYRKDLVSGTSTLLGDVSITGSTGQKDIEDTTITNSTVAHSTYAYLLYLEGINPSGAAGDLDLYSVQVEYEATKLSQAV